MGVRGDQTAPPGTEAGVLLEGMATILAGPEDFDLPGMLRRVAKGRNLTFQNLNVTQASVFGKPVCFHWRNANDPIQWHHKSGRFYEMEELQAIARYFPLGGVFVDIGANVGNHSLFVSRFLSPSCVIPVEPNRIVIDLLLANIMLNGLGDAFDFSALGVGLSDQSEDGFGMEKRVHNIGGARMLKGAGDVSVRRGDDLLRDVTPSLIKIDVEGMEMKVLAGLSETLERSRPVIFVEVDRRNEASFRAWLDGTGYAIVEQFQRYRANINYLLKAK